MRFKMVLKKLIPHAVVVISTMYFVFFGIDRVNSAMAFINNNLTRLLFIVLPILAGMNAYTLIVEEKKIAELRRKRLRAARMKAGKKAAGTN